MTFPILETGVPLALQIQFCFERSAFPRWKAVTCNTVETMPQLTPLHCFDPRLQMAHPTILLRCRNKKERCRQAVVMLVYEIGVRPELTSYVWTWGTRAFIFD